MQNTKLTWVPKLGWVLIFFLILLMLAFSAGRGLDIVLGAAGGPPDPYGPPPEFTDRYFGYPLTSLLHMAFGMIFLLFAPLQFWRKFRSRHLTLHRWLGRLLIALALVASITGIVEAHVLPGFGGISTLMGSWFFGSLMVICLVRAFLTARARFITAHREWIIRAFAIGLGVATQRFIIFILMVSQAASFEEMFGPTFWLGTSINLVIAEWWINHTRSKN